MNQKTVAVAAAILVLAALGMWYFEASKPIALTLTPVEESTSTAAGEAAQPAAQKPAAKPAVAPSPVSNTFKSIFTQSGSHECKYDVVKTAGQEHNVIYIADGKMRAEFRDVSGGGTTVSTLMVYNNGILYTWKEGMATGQKSTIRTAADLPSAIPTDLTSGKIMGSNGNNVSWDCHDWLKDPKLLVAPSYVKF